MRSGVRFRIAYGTQPERAEAAGERGLRSCGRSSMAVRFGCIRAKGAGSRRRPLEWSLRRAMIVERMELLREVESWDGQPAK